MTTRVKQIAYWTATLIVVLPTAGSGIPELFANGPAATVQSLHALGYPLYLMKITDLAKLLGAITLLLNRHARLVEWAYAGFTLLFLGATASHLLAGDAAQAPIPFSFFLLLMASTLSIVEPAGLSRSGIDLPTLRALEVARGGGQACSEHGDRSCSRKGISGLPPRIGDDKWNERIGLIWSDPVNSAQWWGCFCSCRCFCLFPSTGRAAAWADLSDD